MKSFDPRWAALAARAFTSGGNHTIGLRKGKQTWCAQIEPVGRSYDNALVDLSTLVMISEGTGSVSQIHAVTGKTSIGVDRDGNGIEEITACFAKDDLRLLFADVRGTTSVPVTFEAVLVTGGQFRASMDVGITAGGGALAASLSPNPFNPSATLSFVTVGPGLVRASLYDVSGRLVRTLLTENFAPAGYHEVAVDGRDGQGRPLSSGVYFYRIETPEETVSGTAMVLK